MTSKLTYKDLKDAIAGTAAAFRLTAKLEAVSPKVFPPTYEGGKYATEMRRIDGKEVPCVLLDSVPSQANRMELALQDAWESGEIELPVVSVDFSAVENPGVAKVTSLQAPHRIVDAILRDSFLGKTKFRATEVGKQLDQLGLANATPLLTYAPHCLVFGMWDSTGPRGGLGVKFARSVVSEVIGINAVAGVKTSSRIDPLNIRANSGVLYQNGPGDWTLDPSVADKDSKGNPKKTGKKSEGKPSDVNHGNQPPQVDEKSGGFTIDLAEQTTVLSLPALRRLRFPAKQDGKSEADANIAARTYLASLGLLGATLAIETGYDLRSRCLLHATETSNWELLGKPSISPRIYSLDRDDALSLYKESIKAVRAAKLPIITDEILLTPSDDLVTLVKKSMELASVEIGGE